MAMQYVNRETKKDEWYYSEEDDNKVLELLREWRPRRIKAMRGCKSAEAIEKGYMKEAKVPEFVGQKLHEIATNIAKKACYRDYPHKDEMINDAVEYIFRYLHNFDPDMVGERSKRINFMSYWTRTIDNQYGKSIQDEKMEDYFKNKSFENMGGRDAFENELSENENLLSVIDNTEIGKDISSRVAEFEIKQDERRARERQRRADAKARRGIVKPKHTNGLARLLDQNKEDPCSDS